MLRNRHFLFLWFVNIAITLAIELFTITILVTVFEQTESTLLAAGTMVARTMLAFLLGPVAGVLVDRFPHKNMLISMDLVRLALVGIAILFLQGDGEVPVAGIYLILAGLFAADVFHRPARLSLIPLLVPHEQLVKANSFILASNQIMVAISYTVGGWLILSVPLRQIGLGVIILFTMVIGTAMLIVVPKRQEAEDAGERKTFWKSLVSGKENLLEIVGIRLGLFASTSYSQAIDNHGNGRTSAARYLDRGLDAGFYHQGIAR